MQLLSLSASSAQTYENCPAWWRAVYEGQRVSLPGGSAANLGTVVHAAMERWVAEGHYITHKNDPTAAAVVMVRLVTEEYWKLFSDKGRLAEAKKMAQTWLDRQDWEGKEVLSTEKKLSFELPTSLGPIPFNYIIDRLDRLDNGDGTYGIEVVDYKSVMRPVQPSDMHDLIQCRAYAAACHLLYPDATIIWVTYDLLRYDTVSIAFTPKECEETIAYLHALAERIIADEEAPETINDKCRWCPRKWQCSAIQAYHDKTVDPLIFSTVGDLAANRAKLKIAISTMEGMLQDVDTILLGDLGTIDGTLKEAEDSSGQTWSIAMASRRMRQPPTVKELARIVGPEKAIEVAGSPTMKAIEGLLTDPDLDADAIGSIKNSIGHRFTPATLTIKPIDVSSRPVPTMQQPDITQP